MATDFRNILSRSVIQYSFDLNGTTGITLNMVSPAPSSHGMFLALFLMTTCDNQKLAPRKVEPGCACWRRPHTML
eukprot:2116771-Amphidinium_carterae.2